MNRFIVAQSKDPYKNLALEAWLFENGRQDVWLYLWQNQHTVVIGRNQNAWKECRLSALEADGGKLARRGSGGGAVYHDVGNLNFTFILPRDVYDLRRQLGVILAAMERLGIPARFTGRNDLVTQDGAKFSGNAFQFSAHTALHHGTILVAADMGALSQYLAPSKAKLAAKGVDSVRSRVCNLNTLRPRSHRPPGGPGGGCGLCRGIRPLPDPRPPGPGPNGPCRPGSPLRQLGMALGPAGGL